MNAAGRYKEAGLDDEANLVKLWEEAKKADPAAKVVTKGFCVLPDRAFSNNFSTRPI